MKFLVDSNVIRTAGLLRRLVVAMGERGGTLLVPALVYAERVRQVRTEKGELYNQRDIDGWFERFAPTLQVEPFDKASAEALAQRLSERFPTSADWQRAKRLAPIYAAGQAIPDQIGAGHIGAPVDLYIAGLGTVEVPVVSDDSGREWRGAPAGTVISYQEALRRIAAA